MFVVVAYGMGPLRASGGVDGEIIVWIDYVIHERCYGALMIGL